MSQLSSTTISEATTNSTEVTEETRAILTPFAFKIDESLFGLPIAKPWRRLAAISIDGLAIAILSELPAEFFGLVLACLGFYWARAKVHGGKLAKPSFGKKLLALIAAFFMFVFTLAVINLAWDWLSSNTSASPTKSSQSKVSTSGNKNNLIDSFSSGDIKSLKPLIPSNCKTIKQCEQDLLPIIDLLVPSNGQVNAQNLAELLEVKLALSDLADSEKSKLYEKLYQQYLDKRTQFVAKKIEKQYTPQPTQESKSAGAIQSKQSDENADERLKSTSQTLVEQQKSKQEYSLLKQIETLLEDLGLSFGWAAFYFTVLTRYWHGQTLGKKLLGIRVIQLDGTPLSLMDSFNRYGGYGAGLATGLLGFLQVYWDANRQAIQDKISATVVIKV